MTAQSAVPTGPYTGDVVCLCDPAECLHTCLQQENMADRNRDRAEGNAEDTDELLYTDLNVNSSVCDLDRQPLRRDHCDLLLDAIDAQLGQLQVQSKNHQGIFRKHDCSDVVESISEQRHRPWKYNANK
ncbi:Hypothetical protein SMAX5B_016594 [Scophthalmus maximus]|uniref:Uncharacterized protein n=1 Tax=Scophthalmus maximus TaxID=52904 RepID=A0A2U9BT61_SCOMX|nr:Hypothetical protein SMAX5B_016594 [Scophthalmus maximus]